MNKWGMVMWFFDQGTFEEECVRRDSVSDMSLLFDVLPVPHLSFCIHSSREIVLQPCVKSLQRISHGINGCRESVTSCFVALRFCHPFNAGFSFGIEHRLLPLAPGCVSRPWLPHMETDLFAGWIGRGHELANRIEDHAELSVILLFQLPQLEGKVGVSG